MSDAYAAWREQTFGSDYMIWHDGLDTGAVSRLSGEARSRAIEMVARGLELGDWVAVRSAAAMGEKAFGERLRALLPAARGKLAISLARSLRELEGDLSGASAIIAVLSHPWWGERIDAAMALREFGGHPDVIPALLRTVREDPEYLPRVHASDSLLQLGGIVPAETSKHSELFAHVVHDADGDSPEAVAHRAAAAEMLAALLRLS